MAAVTACLINATVSASSREVFCPRDDPPGGHWELEQILEQGRGAGDRQVVHVQQVGADHVQPRPVGHSTFHLSREHAGIDRVTQAPFLNPLMLNRFHPDRRHVDDLPCRGDGPGNATQ